MHAGQLVNSASCTATATATSSGSATDAVVELSASAAAKTCGEDSDVSVEAEVQAIATAVAEAAVQVTGECKTQGDAQGTAVAAGVAKKTYVLLHRAPSPHARPSLALKRFANLSYVSCLHRFYLASASV